MKVIMIAVAAVLLACVPTPAQRSPITESDRQILYRLLLTDYDFRLNKGPAPATIIVNLRAGTIPPEYLPSLTDVKFEYVSDDEIGRMKNSQDGLNYYEFGTIARRRGRISLPFDWTGSSAASWCTYYFHKVRGSWRIHSIGCGHSIA